MSAANGTASGGSEDVARMQALLREAGITEYEPRVLSQLLDIAYATTAQLLTGARAISQHCGKMIIEEGEVQMAMEFSGALSDNAPNRDRLIMMAAEKNSQPLPQIRHNFGLKLPNDRFCLLQPNVEWRGSDPHQMVYIPSPQIVEPQPAVQPRFAENMLKRKAENDDFD